MYDPELQLAVSAARAAGALLNKKVCIKVDDEAGKDIKLSSDKNSEKLIIDTLQPSGIPILSEEFGRIGGDNNEYLWIVDPLDGTANYWRGMDKLSCVSIALWRRGCPLLGVVYRFAADEMYCGIVGNGAFLNSVPIHVSDITEQNKAFLATGFPVKRDYGTESLALFITQIQRYKKIRMLGSAAYMGVLVATGKLDAYVEEDIMLWDVAAAAAIVKAAGGIAEIKLHNNNSCICRLFSTRELMEDHCGKII